MARSIVRDLLLLAIFGSVMGASYLALCWVDRHDRDLERKRRIREAYKSFKGWS